MESEIITKLSTLVKDASNPQLGGLVDMSLAKNILKDEPFLDKIRKKGIRIFVDMDGVLTDWKKQYLKYGGQDFINSEQIDWDVTDNFSFWSTMDWIGGGKELWGMLKPLNPVILSSPGYSSFSREGKQFWIKENLGENQSFILDTKKEKYADARSFLIDDMPKNIDPWENAGGEGILYKENPYSAARELHRKVMEVS